jgi:predicted nuclease of predicted toxin-antitoxin system
MFATSGSRGRAIATPGERPPILGAVIVTKEEDFPTFRALQSQGPAIVWIRIGNTTRDTLIKTMSSLLTAIISALERGETVVEITHL